MPDTVLQPRRHLGSVEMLRGLAALSVTWFHMTNTYPAGWVRASGSYGWLGVEAFFVISGFVVPYSLYTKNYNVSQFARFMLKRTVRLEPPYVASILVVIALGYLAANAPGFAGKNPNFTLAQAVSNALYLVPFTNYSWINIVYWTLFFELVFYISAGLTFGLIISISISPLICTFFLLILIGYLLNVDIRVILHFLSGIIAFRYFVGIDDTLKSVAASLTTFLVISSISGVVDACVSVGAAAFIVFINFPPARFLSALGAISYSLYLLHVPIGGRVVNMMRRFGSDEWHYLASSTLGLITSMVAAAIFWSIVERPAQEASKSISLLLGNEDGVCR